MAIGSPIDTLRAVSDINSSSAIHVSFHTTSVSIVNPPGSLAWPNLLLF